NQNQPLNGRINHPATRISLDASSKYPSKLPQIEIQNPAHIIGKSTIQAMQSVVFHAFVGQVDAIIQQIKDDVEHDVTVIATGGLASLIASGSEAIDYVDPHLTLKGLALIYEKNKTER